MEGRTSASVGWVLSRDVYFKGTCIHSPPACLPVSTGSKWVGGAGLGGRGGLVEGVVIILLFRFAR